MLLVYSQAYGISSQDGFSNGYLICNLLVHRGFLIDKPRTTSTDGGIYRRPDRGMYLSWCWTTMSEFSRNMDTEPMSRSQRNRVQGVRSVLAGLVQHHPIYEQPGAIGTVKLPHDYEPTQMVLDIEPKQAGFNMQGDYTTGSF